MGLDIRKTSSGPPRILLYGAPGIGKSTWASTAPGVVFLPVEDGLGGIEVDALPRPATWDAMIGSVGSLIKEQHEYRVLAIDTVDAAEPLADASYKEENGKDYRDEGYGKGYAAIVQKWRHLLAGLDRLRDERNMAILLVAHAQVRQHLNPVGDNYDRYELKVQQRVASILTEWADAVLFATWAASDGLTTGKDKLGRARIKATLDERERIILCRDSAAAHAKNRWGLQSVVEMSTWADLMAERK